ncbi:uncharacterized protein LOC110689908 [Chenopodium quinoa]|uniref:uncharacterized protein LOC110689908 n=1 Tax=Chenopodium quinoa TaxID=63459 RepID=UPI000B7842D6|nr:uncharacterized protein LOC110689908 [Chenopodium quinoa]
MTKSAKKTNPSSSKKSPSSSSSSEAASSERATPERPSHNTAQSSSSCRPSQSNAKSPTPSCHSQSHPRGTPQTGPISEEVEKALAIFMDFMKAHANQQFPPPVSLVHADTIEQSRNQRRRIGQVDGGRTPSHKELGKHWEEDTCRTERERKRNP